jgi:hypothetical protein
MPKFNYGLLQDGRTPGPEIPVEVRSPIDESLPVEVFSILDTGANVSCVPEDVILSLQEFGNLDYSYRFVKGSIGEPERRKFFKVYLTVAGNRLLKEFEVLRLRKRYGILGRDALDCQIVILNGPRQRVIIRSSIL